MSPEAAACTYTGHDDYIGYSNSTGCGGNKQCSANYGFKKIKDRFNYFCYHIFTYTLLAHFWMAVEKIAAV
jgi:hypothetical protein